VTPQTPPRMPGYPSPAYVWKCRNTRTQTTDIANERYQLRHITTTARMGTISTDFSVWLRFIGTFKAGSPSSLLALCAIPASTSPDANEEWTILRIHLQPRKLRRGSPRRSHRTSRNRGAPGTRLRSIPQRKGVAGSGPTAPQSEAGTDTRTVQPLIRRTTARPRAARRAESPHHAYPSTSAFFEFGDDTGGLSFGRRRAAWIATSGS